MIVLPYTERVASHKGVIGFDSPKNHCAPAAEPRSSCGFSIRVSSFGGSDGRPHGLPVHASGSRSVNPSELPPLFDSGVGGFCKPNHLEATMANSVCTRTSAQTPTTSTTDTPDPVQLLMQAVNGLERAKSCLLAQYPMYGFAQQQLELARQAVEALGAIELNGGV